MPREPEPAELPLGTVVQMNGEKRPRVVGLLNPHGHAMAYRVTTARSGRNLHFDTMTIDPRDGGTVDTHDIKGERKRRVPRNRFLQAWNRGNRANINNGLYSQGTAEVLTRLIEDNWLEE